MLAVRKAVKEKGTSQFCFFFPIHFSVMLISLRGSAHSGQEEGEHVTGAHRTPADSRVAEVWDCQCQTSSLKPGS